MPRYSSNERVRLDGNLVKKAREKKGLSQLELAALVAGADKKCSCSVQTIGKIERGEIDYTSKRRAEALATTLKVGLSDIVNASDGRSSPKHLRGYSLFGLHSQIQPVQEEGVFQDFNFDPNAEVVNQPLMWMWADPRGGKIEVKLVKGSERKRKPGSQYVCEVKFKFDGSHWGSNASFHPQCLTPRVLNANEKYLRLEMKSVTPTRGVAVAVRVRDRDLREWQYWRTDGTGRKSFELTNSFSVFDVELFPDPSATVVWSTGAGGSRNRIGPRFQELTGITLDFGIMNPREPAPGSGTVQIRPILLRSVE